MATVQQTKDALLATQENAFRASEVAISAIDTLLNFQMWALGIIAVIIALVAFFGWQVVKIGAREAAEKIATERIDSYIKSEEFRDRASVRIGKEVEKRMEDKFIVAHIEKATDNQKPDAFTNLKDTSNDPG